MDLGSPGEKHRQAVPNAQAPWAGFDSRAYVKANYLRLHDEDAEIISIMRDHFGDYFREHRQDADPVIGIDVGAGANLYPALAMLPWCKEITLVERSPQNLEYLESQLESYDENWNQFWTVLRENAEYQAYQGDPRRRFHEVTRVEPGNLLDFDRIARRGPWSVGTMFFVAESMTTEREEFDRGVGSFMRALAPGAPFFAAFMEHSEGYHVGAEFFPACDVGEQEVYESLEPFAGKIDTLRLKRLGAPGNLRKGYSGMIVAYGRRNLDSDIPES
ncbi:SCO2525 family SAM-dependent methyltransferase [Streptomyces sp. NPDC047042]|uniref:SCO2525 family SAM-dependent methyltransferase n=1 Tax=Streptomyces sp. NPDC047042 TaxID=3154807 RepID=UPI0033D171E7